MKGKARALSSSATITVKDPIIGVEIKIGEVDKFSAKSTSSIIKSRPIGTALETTQYKYGGYDLSFSGGKIDWELANLLHAQDTIARSIGECPKFTVEQRIVFYDGHVETYLYNNVILSGYGVDINSGDEIQESFSGYATERNQFGLEQIGSIAYNLVNSVVQEAINEGFNKLSEEIGLF